MALVLHDGDGPEAMAADARRARRALATQLDAWGFGQLGDDVALVASELITNANTHGGGCRRVTLSALPEHRIRIEVADNSPQSPQPRTAADHESHGRGLQLVDAIATRWGVAADSADAEVGKVVWAEFELA